MTKDCRIKQWTSEKHETNSLYSYLVKILFVTEHDWWGGACGVMGIFTGNGHGDTSSNSGRDWLHFT